MNLNLAQIKSITTGAAEITQQESGIYFGRFTTEQEYIYQQYSKAKGKSLHLRCLAPAGVRLRFRTNSTRLGLKINVAKCSSRVYFSFDVFADGKLVGYLDNFKPEELPENYTECPFPLGEFQKDFDLGQGDKEVCVYFPALVCPLIQEVSLDDGAYITPVKPEKKILTFGDSITQGYDATRSSLRYATVLADRLGAEERCKAIGGEIFFPDLAATKEDFQPDYITVAYGTNDFSICLEEDFKKNCAAFFANLAENYPNAKIFALTPIWRMGYEIERKCGSFAGIAATIREATAAYQNITVISGFDFVPKDPAYFADQRLHPNDAGFRHYAENAYQAIKPYL